MKNQLNSEDLEYLIAVHKAINLTHQRFCKLSAFFENNWKKVFLAKISELQSANLDKLGIEKFLSERDKINPAQVMEELQKCGAKILVYGQPDFPLQLENIPQPPVVLFYQGEFLKSDFPSISVVGSRALSSYGKRAIEQIVGEIAQSGVTITSGFALGADTIAHQTAFKNNTRTICVLGNGINYFYPTQNINFAKRLLHEKKGVFVSEYFPGVEPRAEHFPMRNRIVSGLSKATIVIEATEKSGSLITAGFAIDQGRDVFAVPGDIFSHNSDGTNQLILNNGVYPALSGRQILEHLGFSNLAEKKEAQLQIPETGTEAKILKLFGTENRVHINDLIRRANFSVSEVSAYLALMELKGLVKNLGNQEYSKNF